MQMPDIGGILGNSPILSILIVGAIIWYIFIRKKK